jgi:hypothetical protein
VSDCIVNEFRGVCGGLAFYTSTWSVLYSSAGPVLHSRASRALKRAPMTTHDRRGTRWSTRSTCAPALILLGPETWTKEWECSTQERSANVVNETHWLGVAASVIGLSSRRVAWATLRVACCATRRRRERLRQRTSGTHTPLYSITRALYSGLDGKIWGRCGRPQPSPA